MDRENDGAESVYLRFIFHLRRPNTLMCRPLFHDNAIVNYNLNNGLILTMQVVYVLVLDAGFFEKVL